MGSAEIDGRHGKLRKAGEFLATPSARKSKQARSSVGLERFLDTEEVDGSNPFGPTIISRQF